MSIRDPVRSAYITAVVDADRLIGELQRLKGALRSMPTNAVPADYRDEVAGELAEIAASMTYLRGGVGLVDDLIVQVRGPQSATSPVLCSK